MDRPVVHTAARALGPVAELTLSVANAYRWQVCRVSTC